MTIKKVRILDIHPHDSFYDDKNKIIGKKVFLDIDDKEYIEGWSSSSEIFKQQKRGKYHYYEFYAIKVEEVS